MSSIPPSETIWKESEIRRFIRKIAIAWLTTFGTITLLIVTTQFVALSESQRLVLTFSILGVLLLEGGIIVYPVLRKTWMMLSLQSTLDALSLHLAILDEQGRIIRVNQAWRDFADSNDWKDSSYGIGTNYLTLCEEIPVDQAEDASLASKGIRDVLTGNLKRFSMEYPCHSPTEKRWFFMNITRFLENGKPRLVVTHENITARKIAENRQDALVKELEAVNRELKNFAYVVSHDLKAPLRAISSLANWVSLDYSDRLDDEGRQHLRLLQGRVKRMHNLIDGILQYSRVGRIREAMVPIPLELVIPQIVQGIDLPANIKVETSPKFPDVVCEPTRIEQVFQNLLSNSVKYMDKPEGYIRVNHQDLGAFWEFSVSDNGPGIEERFFEKIFQIFQTLQPRDEFESTGIGLSIVKKIVEMYGGAITVESEIGKGTTIRFTLPKAIPQ